VVYFLVYVSSATHQLSRAELDDILESSRVNNSAADISGALLYKGGNVMQVLEGEQSAVKGLYGKICRDPRHNGIISIWEGTQESRQFPRWSMAFGDLDSAETAARMGYSDFFDAPLDSTEWGSDLSQLHKLLSTFRQSM
jgi:hypothetical protein